MEENASENPGVIPKATDIKIRTIIIRNKFSV